MRAGVRGFGSERVLVGPRAFKACVGRLVASGVGSIPTRSRHSVRAALSGRGPRQRRPRVLRRTVRARGKGLVPRILLVSLALAAPAAGAQPSFESDGGRGAESAAPVSPAAAEERLEEPADTLAVARGTDAPSWVMFRSLALPGWGQLKNGAVWKAVLCAGAGAAFYERLVFESGRIDHYRRARAAAQAHADLAAYYESKVARHRGHRRDFVWWTSLFLLLCGGDAYVDAHLKGFDVRIQAVPESEPPAAEGAPETAAVAAQGSGFGLRAGLYLRF